jgi:competence protein ComEC
VTCGLFSAFMARTLEPSFRSKPAMDVKFLDVGQGDAILIEYPNGKNALIDACRSVSVIDAALKAEGIRKIDTFIATHPDADHIGGAEFVIKNYGVTKVIDSGQIHTT